MMTRDEPILHAQALQQSSPDFRQFSLAESAEEPSVVQQPANERDQTILNPVATGFSYHNHLMSAPNQTTGVGPAL